MEAWRTEAWCYEHERIEPIHHVISASARSITGEVPNARQTVVRLACGERASIVMTDANRRRLQEAP